MKGSVTTLNGFSLRCLKGTVSRDVWVKLSVFIETSESAVSITVWILKKFSKKGKVLLKFLTLFSLFKFNWFKVLNIILGDIQVFFSNMLTWSQTPWRNWHCKGSRSEISFFYHWATMRFWALFTSGHNSVGTGDWEYRLRSRIVSRHSPPPGAASWGVGGCVVVIRFCLLPVWTSNFHRKV